MSRFTSHPILKHLLTASYLVWLGGTLHYGISQFPLWVL